MVLLIVDTQKLITNEKLYRFEDLAANIRILIHTARQNGIEVICISPFRDTGLLEYLKSKGETELIVAGLQTDYCIDATIKCGFEHGFKVYVPAHANSTFDNAFMTAEETYHYYNGFIWNGRYAECVSMKEMMRIMNNENERSFT